MGAYEGEDDHVAEEGPVEEEFPGEVFEDAGFGEALFLALAEEAAVEIALGEV